MKTCSVNPCDRQHYAKGFCGPHWRRWKKTGDPGPAEIRGYGVEVCSFTGCGRPHSCKGLCPSHYAQARRGLKLTPLKPYGQGPQTTQQLAMQSRYGITLDRYNEMLIDQGGVCALCGGVNKGGRALSVDHDHDCCRGPRSCGRCVRALLCGNCNLGLGHFHDDVDLMSQAIKYVEAHRDPRA